MALRESTRDDAQNDLAIQRNRTRDEVQKVIDEKVKGLVSEWDAAGQPDTGNPFLRFDVDDRTDGKRRILRAFSLVSRDHDKNLGPMWYKDSEPDDEGWITLKFGVKEVERKTDDETPAGNGETPAAEPAAEPETPAAEPETPADEPSGRGFRRGR